MPFHRLTVPSYTGGLPSGYDYVNNAVVGTPAPAEGARIGGPSAGTYFFSTGDDATAPYANRGLAALAQNTDYLDDLFRRDLATPIRADVAGGGSTVSSFVLPANTFVGVPGTPNTPEGIGTFISITDEDGQPLFNGSRCLVTSITGAAVGSNFSVGAITCTVSPVIPASTNYRIYYGTKSNLATMAIDTIMVQGGGGGGGGSGGGAPGGPAGGALSGIYPDPTIVLTGNAGITGLLPVTNIAPGTNGYVLTTTAGVTGWAVAPIGFVAGTDLAGTASNQTVVGITGAGGNVSVHAQSFFWDVQVYGSGAAFGQDYCVTDKRSNDFSWYAGESAMVGAATHTIGGGGDIFTGTGVTGGRQGSLRIWARGLNNTVDMNVEFNYLQTTFAQTVQAPKLIIGPITGYGGDAGNPALNEDTSFFTYLTTHPSITSGTTAGILATTENNGSIALATDATGADTGIYIRQGGAWLSIGPVDATTGVKGVVQLAGDLAGTGTAAATPRVGALTGASGVIPIATTGNILRWAAGTTAPGIAQVQATAGAGATMMVETQASAAGSGLNGGDYVLRLGKSEPVNTGTGRFFVQLADEGGAGPYGGAPWEICHFKRNGGYVANLTMGGGTNGIGAGVAASQISSYPALSLASHTQVSIGAIDDAAGSTTLLYIDSATVNASDEATLLLTSEPKHSSSGTVSDLRVNTIPTGLVGTTHRFFDAWTGASYGAATYKFGIVDGSTALGLEWGALANAPLISQLARTTDAVPRDMVFSPQAPWASATGANRTPGGLTINLAEPTNSGTTYSKFLINCGTAASQSLSISKMASLAGVMLNLDTGTYLYATAPAIGLVASVGVNLGTPAVSFRHAGLYGWTWEHGTTDWTVKATTYGTSILYTQDDLASGTAATWTMRAQASLSGAGGKFVVGSGDGTTADGAVEIRTGGTLVISCTGDAARTCEYGASTTDCAVQSIYSATTTATTANTVFATIPMSAGVNNLEILIIAKSGTDYTALKLSRTFFNNAGTVTADTSGTDSPSELGHSAGAGVLVAPNFNISSANVEVRGTPWTATSTAWRVYVNGARL